MRKPERRYGGSRIPSIPRLKAATAPADDGRRAHTRGAEEPGGSERMDFEFIDSHPGFACGPAGHPSRDQRHYERDWE
jgi:hypothetical protein